MDAICECCERAGEHEVRIGIQNHHDIGVPTRSFYHLIEESDHPNLVAMFDLWSIFLLGENLETGMKLKASKIGFTTVADYVVLPRARYR